MFVGLLTMDIHVPGAASLKDKRSVVKGLKDRIRARFNVSVCESSETSDLWQRALIGVASVSSEKSHAGEALDKVAELVRSNPDLDILDYTVEII